jgi:hypothetical protein
VWTNSITDVNKIRAFAFDPAGTTVYGLTHKDYGLAEGAQLNMVVWSAPAAGGTCTSIFSQSHWSPAPTAALQLNADATQLYVGFNSATSGDLFGLNVSTVGQVQACGVGSSAGTGCRVLASFGAGAVVAGPTINGTTLTTYNSTTVNARQWSQYSS